jgi:hypothetical protein
MRATPVPTVRAESYKPLIRHSLLSALLPRYPVNIPPMSRPVGTMPQPADALALYLGHQHSDVATIRWRDIEDLGANVVQSKTDKPL